MEQRKKDKNPLILLEISRHAWISVAHYFILIYYRPVARSFEEVMFFLWIVDLGPMLEWKIGPFWTCFCLTKGGFSDILDPPLPFPPATGLYYSSTTDCFMKISLQSCEQIIKGNMG